MSKLRSMIGRVFDAISPSAAIAGFLGLYVLAFGRMHWWGADSADFGAARVPVGVLCLSVAIWSFWSTSRHNAERDG